MESSSVKLEFSKEGYDDSTSPNHTEPPLCSGVTDPSDVQLDPNRNRDIKDHSERSKHYSFQDVDLEERKQNLPQTCLRVFSHLLFVEGFELWIVVFVVHV